MVKADSSLAWLNRAKRGIAQGALTRDLVLSWGIARHHLIRGFETLVMLSNVKRLAWVRVAKTVSPLASKP